MTQRHERETYLKVIWFLDHVTYVQVRSERQVLLTLTLNFTTLRTLARVVLGRPTVQKDVRVGGCRVGAGTWDHHLGPPLGTWDLGPGSTPRAGQVPLTMDLFPGPRGRPPIDPFQTRGSETCEVGVRWIQSRIPFLFGIW